MKTKEELEELGIDFSAENNNELYPSINNGFMTVCKRCGCNNVARTRLAKRDAEGNFLKVGDLKETTVDCFICPNCKLIEEA